MRSRLDEQLDILNHEMIEMGSLCETAIEKVALALARDATARAESRLVAEIREVDEEIEHKERDIEALCLRLLQQQQPVARDLRQISAALKMITDMRRIGDQAEDIASIIAGHKGEFSSLAEIETMAKETIRMVKGAVDAYVSRDTEKAAEVIRYDDAVDLSFQQVKRRLIAEIAKNADDGAYTLDLLMIAKYFERIGDHGVNIAEWVVFSVTGKHGDENDE